MNDKARIEKCDQNVTKFEEYHKKKVSNLLKINKLETCSRGANGNRTSDTRIFSPLLYQLSYGTLMGLLSAFMLCRCVGCDGLFCFSVAKVGTFFESAKCFAAFLL